MQWKQCICSLNYYDYRSSLQIGKQIYKQYLFIEALIRFITTGDLVEAFFNFLQREVIVFVIRSIRFVIIHSSRLQLLYIQWAFFQIFIFILNVISLICLSTMGLAKLLLINICLVCFEINIMRGSDIKYTIN